MWWLPLTSQWDINNLLIETSEHPSGHSGMVSLPLNYQLVNINCQSQCIHSQGAYFSTVNAMQYIDQPVIKTSPSGH
jgi:hypothetical protein